MSLPPNAWRYAPVGWPLLRCPANNLGFSTFSLDASTDALEFFFQAPEFAITRVGFRQGSVTGTAPTYRWSLQGVTGTPLTPDGTIKSSTNAYADVTPVSGGNSTWQWLTLTSSYTPTPGELLSLVAAYISGTINGSNLCQFTTSLEGNSNTIGFPFVITNNAGSRTRNLTTPCFAVGGAGGEVYGLPAEAVTILSSFDSGDTPDEHAVRFRLPPSLGSDVAVAGLRVQMDATNVTASNSLLFRLYTDAGALLATASWDTVYRSTTGLAVSDVVFPRPWPRVRSGEWHRLGIAPQGTTPTMTIYHFEADAAGDLDAYPLGTDMHASYRTNEGAWTNVPIRRLMAAVLVADIEPAYSPRTRPLRRHQ